MGIFGLLGQVTNELFQPKGEVTLTLEPRVGVAGTKLRGSATFASPDRARHLVTLSVHLQLATTRIVPGTDPQTGKPTWGPQTETRDVLAPHVLARAVDLAAREAIGPFAFELVVPEGLPPSIPGQLEYLVLARGDVQDQVIDPWAQVALVIGAGHARPEPPSASLEPGASILAPCPSGAMAPGMVVESRGAVTLVQWADGTPATWVRTDAIA